MSRLLLALCSFSLAGCFADAPPDDSFGDGAQDEAGDDESESSDGAGESEGAEPGSTGEALAGLHEFCEVDADCEGGVAYTGYQSIFDGSASGAVSCAANTCTWWAIYSYWLDDEATVAVDGDSPCAAGETWMTIYDDNTALAVCALSAEVVDGLGVCPESMSAVVWTSSESGDYVTCWYGDVLGGQVCQDDGACGGGTHCMGQPSGASGYLPSVCR